MFFVSKKATLNKDSFIFTFITMGAGELGLKSSQRRVELVFGQLGLVQIQL